MRKLSRKERISSRGKSLSVLPLCQKIKDDIRRGLKMGASTGPEVEVWPFISDLGSIDECDATEALKCMKEISAHLSNDNLPDFVLESLVGYFIITESKTPLKRAIASNLDGIKGNGMSRKVQEIFRDIFEELVHETFSQSSIKTGKHIVELLAMCSTGFTFGKEVICSRINIILIFLHWFLEITLSNDQANGDKDFENDVCTTFKCTVSILKKCVVSDMLNKSDCGVLEEIHALCEAVLITDTFGWDSRNAAGMTWVIIWKTLLDNNAFLFKVTKTMDDLQKKFIENAVAGKNRETGTVLVNKGLSLCSGIMSTLTIDDLVLEIETENDCPKCLILHCLLPYLRNAEKECKSISQQVILSKCFAKWTSLLLDSMKTNALDSVKKYFMGEKMSDGVIADFLSYAITKLEHPTDAIRHQGNEVLINTISIGKSLVIEDFSQIILKNVLSQNWRKRSTFTALNCVLPHVPVECIFDACSNVAQRLLDAMIHQSLAPYASETYKILICTVKDFSKKSVSDINEMHQKYALLLDTMIDKMCTCNAHSLRLLIDYCFEKILKSCGNGCLVHIFSTFQSRLSSCAQNVRLQENARTLAAFLSCMKMAAFKSPAKKNDAALYGDNYLNLLRSSLIHEDDEIRHLGVALLCESVKPSSLVPYETLCALRYALPFNFSCQDPAFRQKLANSLRKLFIQLRGNMSYLKKTGDEIGDVQNGINFHAYEEFIIWLSKYTTSQIYPAAPYPKRVTCINVLTLIINIFVDLELPFTVDFSSVFTQHTVHSVFTLLSDPYGDIKEMSFAILKNINLRRYISNYMSEEWLDIMLAKALDRACTCPKPECCTDAAYHIKLYCTLHENLSSARIGLCQKLLDLLKNSVDLTNKNFYLAATSSPMYGVLHCLKSLFQGVEFRELEVDILLQWRHLVSCAIDACFRVSLAVLPVVGSVSPEGHLPQVEQASSDEVTGGADDAWNELPDTLKSLILDDQDEAKTRALAQQVLICCWRSAKESSLLLQELTSSRFPLDSTRDCKDGIVSWKQFLNIGDHLRKQLMEARHRGAFEIAYYAFKAYCPRLWNTEHQELNSIPKKWLDSCMSDINDPSRSKDLCATRRSAGLPFMMQALLSGNRRAEGKRHLSNVMTTLLNLCKTSDATGVVTKVHALNILRGLVKDASLGEEILPFVSECLQVSLTGFSSALWSVRNSSTLLFSALFTRIFGVKRDKDDEFALKNRLSGNEFFSRLPGLHSFLIKRMEMICLNLDKGGHYALSPSLHPILMLLSRIYPSAMQPTTSIGLDGFITILIRCRASAVYKSRVATAAALSSVLPWDQRLSVLQKCCDNLVEDVCILRGKILQEKDVKSSPQNRIHGGLLQIAEIVGSYARDDLSNGVDVLEFILPVCNALLNVMPFLGSRENNCPLTRATSLEIFLQVDENLGDDCKGIDRVHWGNLTEEVRKSCSAEISDNSGASHPSYSFLIQACAKVAILLRKRSSSTLPFAALLSTKDPDSIAALLDALLRHWVEVERELPLDGYEALATQLSNIILCNSHNDQIATATYQILSRIASSQTATGLFQHSLETAALCNTAQSALLEAVLKFQSCCMVLVTNGSLSVSRYALESWVAILSSASKCYENTDRVRLAVAKSLLDNSSLLSDCEGLLGGDVVQLWRILIDLLCDEDYDVRKVACYTVYETTSKFDMGPVNTGHPCVNDLALIQSIVTLILTHGWKHTDPCRHILKSLARSESAIVPNSTEISGDGEDSFNDVLPGLFERSEANTYFDAQEISRIANVGLDMLEDIGGSLEPSFLSLIKKFE